MIVINGLGGWDRHKGIEQVCEAQRSLIKLLKPITIYKIIILGSESGGNLPSRVFSRIFVTRDLAHYKLLFSGSNKYSPVTSNNIFTVQWFPTLIPILLLYINKLLDYPRHFPAIAADINSSALKLSKFYSFSRPVLRSPTNIYWIVEWGGISKPK